jgi:carboxypeptidase C (cathepsin A)
MNDKKNDQKKTQDQEHKKDQRELLGLEPVTTEHKLPLKGRELKYSATAGVIPLKDDKGEIEAEIFFTAYELETKEDKSQRPLTFAFNGGPGSSSIWLHMGALGPKRVLMEKEGWMPAPPHRLVPNEYTWLDTTDLVFIDPVGTGYSRAAKEEHDKKFWSYQGDLDSVGEFIRLYLSRYQRWSSPLFLAGESYGTTRAAGLAGDLIDKGITFNGIFLISTAMDLRPIRFIEGDDLPYQLYVPTYTATAWYHKKLADQLLERDLPDLLAEVEAWAESELTVALMKGDRIDSDEKNSVAKKLAWYTGLDLEYVLGTNLRINIHRFCKELTRSERRSVGRLDSRFKGIEALEVTEQPEFDPSLQAITPPYTATYNTYIRAELNVETDLTYEVLSMHINQKWEWEKGQMPTTGARLRSAMAKNPFLKVFVGQGYYDLATPLFATQYMVSHMNIDPKLRENLQIQYYPAGHMFYLDLDSLAAFKANVDNFIQAASNIAEA